MYLLVFSVLSSLIAYVTFKHQSLSSKAEIRQDLEECLDKKFHVTTPIAARNHEDINWRGDFSISVDQVKVFGERGNWRKWLPLNGFSGRVELQISLHGTEVPPEEELNEHFVAQNPNTRRLNKHLNNPNKIDVLIDSADVDYITGRYISIFQGMLQDTCFRLDNPHTDDEWLLLPQNTRVTYRNGYSYNTLTESKMLPIVFVEDSEHAQSQPTG
jgi:hypothetical protein